MTSIKIETKGLKRLKNRLGKDHAGIIKDELDNYGDILLKTTREVIPVKTGKLRDSLKKVKVGQLSYGVKEGESYGAILREGSPPHTISIKEKKALSWSGIRHPVRKVNHPGFKARPYPKEAIDQTQNKISQELGDLGKELIE